MRAVAVFPHARAVKIIDVREPQLVRPGEVKLRVLDVGICGTDKEICSFHYGTPPEGSDYLILGHEALGEVVETGPAVRDIAVGDLVAPMVRRPCPHAECLACRSGRPDFCATSDFTERGIADLTHDPHVFRYDPHLAADDGLAGEEGMFSIYSFWLVEALTRAHRLTDARLLLEKMLSYANPVGLHAEEIGVTGEALGNFPQSFTHLALIRACYHLDRALNRVIGPNPQRVLLHDDAEQTCECKRTDTREMAWERGESREPTSGFEPLT